MEARWECAPWRTPEEVRGAPDAAVAAWIDSHSGAKASGLGREGVRYAIEEMTELRMLTIKLD